MGLFSGLSHHVDLKLTAASEEFAAVRALQVWVREVQVEVISQVGPLLKAALTFRAHVGLKQVLFTILCISCSFLFVSMGAPGPCCILDDRIAFICLLAAALRVWLFYLSTLLAFDCQHGSISSFITLQ